MKKEIRTSRIKRWLKVSCLLCVGLCCAMSVVANSKTQPLQEENVSQQKPNMLDKMSDKDWRALNVFFSNFSETTLDQFSASKYENKELIGFAMHHNVINNRDRFDEDSYISEKYVKSTLMKYFGISKIIPEDGDFFSYKSGKFLWEDIFEGGPYFYGSQTIELYDNGDGTFSAITEDYEDNEYFQNNFIEGFGKIFYPPKKNWKSATTKRCKVTGYHAAKIATQSYDGKVVYKLLEWHPAESLEDARSIMKGL